jgi:hypothetical protein
MVIRLGGSWNNPRRIVHSHPHARRHFCRRGPRVRVVMLEDLSSSLKREQLYPCTTRTHPAGASSHRADALAVSACVDEVDFRAF